MSRIRALSARIAERRQTLFAFASSGVNQVFSSATNLLIGFYLVRKMAPAEFGLYNIAFAITIAVAAIGNAVFLIPMTVGVPHDDDPARDRWMLDYIATATLSLSVIGLVLLVAAGIGVRAGLLDVKGSVFTVTTIVSCLSFFLKDSMVQAGYNQGREQTTILINIASAASIALLILIGELWVQDLTAPFAITGYALSQLCALGVGYVLMFRGMTAPATTSLRAIARRLLSAAFWPASSSALALLRAQAHIVVVAAMIGPAGVAVINASRLIFAPVQMAQPALVRAAMPRLVRQLRVDRARFQRSTIAITLGLGAFSLVYCLAMVSAGPWMFRVVVGPQYEYSSLMLIAWGVFVTCVAVRSGLELNQQALQQFKALAGIGLPASLASLAGAYLLTLAGGPPGAVFGLAIGEVSIIALLVLRMRRQAVAERRDIAQRLPSSTPTER